MDRHGHSIKWVAKQTGLSTHVIRIWEKRYAAVTPNRSESNRRMYSDAEVERLQLLHRLTEAGHNIGSVARLSMEDLKLLLQREAPIHRKAELSGGARNERERSQDLVEEALGRIKDFDEEALDQILSKATLRYGHQGLLQKVVVPLTQRIGEEWEAGELKVAHEHFASSVIQTFLVTSAKPFAVAESAPRLLVGTPSGQLHELGAVLVAAAAANTGWKVTYLGPGLPASEIAGAALQNQARAVALSLVYPAGDPHVSQELERLRQFLPKEISILVGGRAADSYRGTVERIGGVLATDLDAVYDILTRLAEEGPGMLG